MNRKLFLPVFVAAASLALFSGCYEAPRPAAATLGNSYTQREKDEKDELFKGISTLTLADAQRIALINNPTYLAAYHSVNAARMRYYQSIGAYSPTIKAGFNLEDSYSTSYNQTLYPGDVTRGSAFTTQTTITANLLLGERRYGFGGTTKPQDPITSFKRNLTDLPKGLLRFQIRDANGKHAWGNPFLNPIGWQY